MWPGKEFIRSAFTVIPNLTTASLQSQSNSYSDPFEVSLPLVRHVDAFACKVSLVENWLFASSFGVPYKRIYDPAIDLNCTLKGDTTQLKGYNRLIMDFTASVAGRQFDRYGAGKISPMASYHL